MRLALGLAALLLTGCLSAPEPDAAPVAGAERVTEGIPDDPDYPPPFAHGSCAVQVTAVMVDGTGPSQGTPCDAEAASGADASAARAALVEVAWDELQSTVANVRIRATGSDASHESSWVTMGGMAYPSPLQLLLHDETLEAIGDGLVVDVLVSGAAYEQPFTVHVSLFEEDLVDPAYSAAS